MSTSRLRWWGPCGGMGVAVLIAASPVRAQIYECDGKWTNLPCQGTVGREMKELRREAIEEQSSPNGQSGDAPAAPQASEPLAPRTELARKLRKLSDQYKSKKGVALSNAELDGFRRFCEDRSRTFDECQARFTEQSQRLTELNQKQEELGLDADRNRIEADKLKAIRGY